MPANAARARRRRARRRARPREPPPLYAYDPDTGRLAVTTPRLQHRDRGGQPAARSRTAGSTSRGCSTADQEVAANIGGRAAGGVRPASCATAAGATRARHPDAGARAAGPPARRCGSRARRRASACRRTPGRAGVRRAVQRPARHGGPTPGGFRARTSHRFTAALRGDPLVVAARRAPGQPSPSTRCSRARERARRSRPSSPTGRASRSARSRSRWAASRRFELQSAASGYSVVPLPPARRRDRARGASGSPVLGARSGAHADDRGRPGRRRRPYDDERARRASDDDAVGLDVRPREVILRRGRVAAAPQSSPQLQRTRKPLGP